MTAERVTRRSALRAAAGVWLGAAIFKSSPAYTVTRSVDETPELANRFPALGLQIASPRPGSRPEIDLASEFGAVGDGVQDDAPAFQALAAAVNAGTIPAGSVVTIPAGRYRIVGNQPVRFNRPIVLRGVGPGVTVIQPEYSQHGSTCIYAAGRGMYTLHSTGVFDGRVETNRYSPGRFIALGGNLRGGDSTVIGQSGGLVRTGDEAYFLCDDYGESIMYAPRNIRSEHFLLKQYVTVVQIDDDRIVVDPPLRHDFAGESPRMYPWEPMRGFGLEHLSFEERNSIPDAEASNTFRAVRLDGTVDCWVWDVHFTNSTSIPLSVQRSRHAVVSECLFDRAQHLGGGGNGYLPEIYQTDDSLVEYCTAVQGRHALICNWTCWGNVFRYNRLVGTPNSETHGEYNVENLYLRNDARGSRMEIGGGGDTVHAHDGPFNELRENYANVVRVLKRNDRDDRLVANWYVASPVDLGSATVIDRNVAVPDGWDEYPFAAYCGHDHAQTAEIARPW